MGEVKIDKIIRTARRSIALVVTNDARLVIRAPYKVSFEYIQKLVNSKVKWIERKQKQFSQRPDKLYLLGKKYHLEIVEGVKPFVFAESSLKMTRACLISPQRYITEWYIIQACQIISERVKYFSYAKGFKFSSIRINSARTRWGSCGPKNSLNFSWRLVAAPVEVIDSVVVHELVHTEIKNHSDLFYRKLKSIIPDYKEREKWLKENTGAFLL